MYLSWLLALSLLVGAGLCQQQQQQQQQQSASQAPLSYVIAVGPEDGYVFFGGRGKAVTRMTTRGENETTLVQRPNNINKMATNNRYVYWAEMSLEFAIYRISFDGGPMETYASRVYQAFYLHSLDYTNNIMYSPEYDGILRRNLLSRDYSTIVSGRGMNDEAEMAFDTFSGRLFFTKGTQNTVTIFSTSGQELATLTVPGLRRGKKFIRLA